MTGKRKILIGAVSLSVLATVAFIWGNSLDSQTVSAAKSGHVLEWLKPLLEFFTGEGTVTNHLVRKLAHFTEYSALGALLAAWLLAVRVWRWRSVLCCLVIGLGVASADETIQIFTGRGPMVRDVLLDFSGVCFGVGCVWLLVLIAEGVRKYD